MVVKLLNTVSIDDDVKARVRMVCCKILSDGFMRTVVNYLLMQSVLPLKD